MTEGTVLYIKDYIFENDSIAPYKYFVILKNVDNAYILAALPTRTIRIPAYAKATLPPHGCIRIDNDKYHCFLFAAGQVVTKCGKSFREDTHIYTRNIEKEAIVDFYKKYPKVNINYEVWGKMKDGLFENLIECFKESDQTLIEYKELL